MDSNELKYWVSFSRIAGVGPVTIDKLKARFGSLEEAWRAHERDLRLAGIRPSLTQEIERLRPQLNPDLELENLARLDIKAITVSDPGYPALLKEISGYPPILYVKGEIHPTTCLAVVGSRKPTSYGREVAAEMASKLATSGVTVVSGLARGIDSIAHRSTLEAGGYTIAVFACGLDHIYPPENRRLAQQISRQGALVSEFPPGVRPRPEFFPRRNRIMSGLSQGVLVIEAGETSGALITAHLALEQNRDVFAIPGNITSPLSRGSNKLIQEGAKLIRGFPDIAEELSLALTEEEPRPATPSSGIESLLLGYLSPEPRHIDEICEVSGLPMAEVSSTLTIMELKGLVKQPGVMSYTTSRGPSSTLEGNK